MKAGKDTGKAGTSLPSPLARADPDESAADQPFPIVGIGASAGGLAAFEAFFSGLPGATDPGMAFVLVQHLAPDHKSILAELVRRYTRMQVFEVEDGMRVQPNCTYIIPPNRHMAFLNGRLELLEPSEPRGQRLPIDFFFRSLADDQHEHAIAIVLAGTGSDGTLGVRAIKAEGGMVMAQDPASTEFDGMPRSAIATGLVDWQLPPAEMPARLIAYAAHAFGKLHHLAADPHPKVEGALKKIFVLLRAQTGHDFSQYKPSSIHRRILRRMSVHQIEALDAYVRFLQQTPTEVEALFGDLLIGVTNFFRDPEAFQILEDQLLPVLFDDRPAGSVIRVWSAGCSSGEEAYSIAILLQERMEALKQSYPVQVFATDIDRRAIATARAGLYPASIAVDVSPQRLARFFSAEAGGAYRIHKSIRDLLIFSEQDLIKDPPFSRLDLISCRNLLIYLGAETQKRLMPMFHYALNPRGVLFLGTSESIGDSTSLFAVLDRKAKLYQRREDVTGMQRVVMSRLLPPRTAIARGAAKTALPVPPSLRELTEQALLQRLAPAAALVNGQGDILYLHGRSGAYLELAPGEAGINNVVKMAREGLRLELSTSLHKAVCSKESVRVEGLRVKNNGHFAKLDLSIHPLTTDLTAPPMSPLYLVILEEARTPVPEAEQRLPGASGGVDVDASDSADARLAAVTEELRARDEYLQSAHEELETANEELKSSNEEMQSVNEGLQSTNEELETSKEELQSVNEELTTVNVELQTKVADLSRANNDMNNLLAGTGIATVFVDHQLRILRFTPSATQIINLIPGDVGRPVAHIVSNLVGYDGLLADLQAVLDTLEPKDAQVQNKSGLWYMMRIRPYRTLDNVIEGAVITFADITEMKRMEDSLDSANKLLRLGVVVRDAFDAITMQDLDGRILAWNPAAVRMYGWSEAEALLMNVRARIPQPLQDEAVIRVDQLGRAEVLEPHLTQRLTSDGSVVDVWVTATPLLNEAGRVYAIATTERLKEAAEVASPGRYAR
ncbi:MAG TPA: chemotaxis protein CheB [Accumulibacter sp.]|uniref:chemotaxis protein CheB n=1 Tax=Accumulibacter sp. TaxID=2053492 RepID=UPI002C66EF80|nr:chemotaxis protein CheB [Accumulibacter sp.]HRD89137.1 chemotaxis protein CheB [Accumulibacter sp.]